MSTELKNINISSLMMNSEEICQNFYNKEESDAISSYLDERIDQIESELTSYATVEELTSYATKSELTSYATIEDLDDYATKSELTSYQEAGNYVSCSTDAKGKEFGLVKIKLIMEDSTTKEFTILSTNS